jgi:antitoxin CptB
MTIASSDGGSSEARRKRLLFRAQRRGFKELDLVFGTFAAAELAGLTAAELDQFEALLDAPDQEVWLWLQDKAPVAPGFDTPVFARLKALCRRSDPDWTL